MKILFIADIVGSPGRDIIRKLLPDYIIKHNINLVIANAENAAGGFGLTPRIADELFDTGVNAITMGNHTWDRKDISDIINDTRIVRPANFPPGTPGHGYTILDTASDRKVCIINLMGRVNIIDIDCPFRKAREILRSLPEDIKMIIVDMHGETTSEKVAMGWFLDGHVSAVIGTHTHVQTADERILPEGTAYITDAGMTGPRDSVIGIQKEYIIKRFLTRMPVKFEIATEDPVFSGAWIEIDDNSGKALRIERVLIPDE